MRLTKKSGLPQQEGCGVADAGLALIRREHLLLFPRGLGEEEAPGTNDAAVVSYSSLLFLFRLVCCFFLAVGGGLTKLRAPEQLWTAGQMRVKYSRKNSL